MRKKPHRLQQGRQHPLARAHGWVTPEHTGFQGILGATHGIQKMILRMQKTIHGLASHDLSNTKPVFLGATPGAIPGNESDKNRCYACKREREREREGEREKEKGRGRGEPARAERTEKKEKTERKRHNAKPDLPSSNEAVLTASNTEEEKRNPGRPQEKKGGRRRRKRREEEPAPGKQQPQKSRKTAKKKELPDSHKQIHTKTRTTNQQKHRQYKTRSSLPKTLLKKRAVTKIELREKPKTGRTFFFAVFGTQNGHFWDRKTSQKTPDSHSKVRGEKPSEKKNLR